MTAGNQKEGHMQKYIEMYAPLILIAAVCIEASAVYVVVHHYSHDIKRFECIGVIVAYISTFALAVGFDRNLHWAETFGIQALVVALFIILTTMNATIYLEARYPQTSLSHPLN